MPINSVFKLFHSTELPMTFHSTAKWSFEEEGFPQNRPNDGHWWQKCSIPAALGLLIVQRRIAFHHSLLDMKNIATLAEDQVPFTVFSTSTLKLCSSKMIFKTSKIFA